MLLSECPRAPVRGPRADDEPVGTEYAHKGVADRRGWAEGAGLLAPELTVVAYDRRGYGQASANAGPFSHLDDLLAVIGHAEAGRCGWPVPRRGTDAREINRLETWLWLDGPAQPEGRVGGAARELALAMNAVIIGNGVPEPEGAGIDAWHRLAEIKVPVTVVCGDLDVPFLVDRCRLLAARLPAARHYVLAAMAHQPYLESPSTVAQLICSSVTEG